jgi:hypothetical protein
MEWRNLNPMTWLGGHTLPDQDRDFGATDNEKIKSLVSMPVILPFIDMMQSADETPAMRIAYRQMLRSPIVKAAFLQGIFSTGSLMPEVHPVSKTNKRDVDIADAFKWQLTRRLDGGIHDMVWNILLHGCVDGLSVNEKIWTVHKEGRYKNKEVLSHLKPKDVDQDLYIWVDEYRNDISVQGLRYNSGERWDPREFVIYRHMPLFGNPGGMSDFRSTYSDFWALDSVEKLRAMGAEKRAFPLIAAEYPATSTQDKLQKALGQMRFSNWLAVPRDTKIQVLNLAGTSDEYFTNFRRDKVENIFLGIQFAFLQSITGGKGQNRGSSEVAKDTAALKVWWLSKKLENIFNSEENGLVKEFVNRNYKGVTDYPLVTLSQRDPEILAKIVKIYKDLWEMGWNLDIEHMEEIIGVPYCQDKKNTLMTIVELQQAMPGANVLGKKKPADQGSEGNAGDPSTATRA